MSVVGIKTKRQGSIYLTSYNVDDLLYSDGLLFRLRLWSPDRKGDMEDIEEVQKRATKLISKLKRMNCIDRLKKNVSCLHYITEEYEEM